MAFCCRGSHTVYFLQGGNVNQLRLTTKRAVRLVDECPGWGMLSLCHVIPTALQSRGVVNTAIPYYWSHAEVAGGHSFALERY